MGASQGCSDTGALGCESDQDHTQVDECLVQENASCMATGLLQGPGIDNLLMRGSQWVVPGELGSTAMTLDGSGNVLQAYFYAPFGQIAQMGGGGTWVRVPHPGS